MWLSITMELRSHHTITTNYVHLAQFRWNYCRDLLKMWKSESIPFQRQDCRLGIGRAVMVCISASGGSWNLIIVNHIQGTSVFWWIRAGSSCTRGSVQVCLWEGGARVVKGRRPGDPGPAEAALQVSYRDCHSFAITLACQKQPPVNDAWVAGSLPSPNRPCSQESHFIVEVIGMLTWIHAIYY